MLTQNVSINLRSVTNGFNVTVTNPNGKTQADKNQTLVALTIADIKPILDALVDSLAAD